MLFSAFTADQWSAPLQSNIRKFLTKTGMDAGLIKAAANASGDRTRWVDWTAPELN